MEDRDKIKELYFRAAGYCSKAEKCPEDVRQYLNKYSDEDFIITSAIKLLETEGYINNERYIKAFINDKYKFAKWGRVKIEYALMQKRFPKSLIKTYLSEIDADEYLSILNSLIKGKIKQNKEVDPAKKKAAIIRFALSKGFEYGDIFKVLEK